MAAMTQNMGLGLLGQSHIIHLTNFRFTFSLAWRGRYIEGLEATASRPQIEVGEAQIDYLNGRTWIPTKGFYQEMECSFWDVAGDDKIHLMSWLATVFEYSDPIRLRQASKRSDYAGVATLTLFSGCGDPLEKWTLGDVWPRRVNWGELDMSSDQPLKVVTTLRYSQVKFLNLCGSQPTSYCSPCGSNS